MISAELVIFIVLDMVASAFLIVWIRSGRKARRTLPALDPAVRCECPCPKEITIRAGVNFLDTLGISSFAPTTAAYKFFHIVSDRIIPGTLNVGGSVVVVVQAFIFVAIIEVDVPTLVPGSVLGWSPTCREEVFRRDGDGLTNRGCPDDNDSIRITPRWRRGDGAQRPDASLGDRRQFCPWRPHDIRYRYGLSLHDYG